MTPTAIEHIQFLCRVKRAAQLRAAAELELLEASSRRKPNPNPNLNLTLKPNLKPNLKTLTSTLI